MSQDNDIVDLDLFKKFKKNQLTDHGKIVYAYHLIQEEKIEEARKVLSSVSVQYYTTEMYRDLSRALLCWATYKNNSDLNLYRESEFFLVVSKLTKAVISKNLIFQNSGYFHDLKNGLFKGFIPDAT